MGVGIEGKSPLQYSAPAAEVPVRRKVRQTASAVSDAQRVFGNQSRGEIEVTKCRGEEDIRSRAPPEKIAGNLRCFSDAPLSGSRIVVLIAGVDVCAMIDEELGGGEIAGEMKGRAAVAAFGIDQRGIGPQQIGQAVNETERRG